MYTWIGILFIWNIFGFVVYAGIQLNATLHTDNYQLLNPREIYCIWDVNYFGCVLLTIIFNLLCPVWTILYWFSKFMHFVCTAGRR